MAGRGSDDYDAAEDAYDDYDYLYDYD